jgi:hypothetical protein
VRSIGSFPILRLTEVSSKLEEIPNEAAEMQTAADYWRSLADRFGRRSSVPAPQRRPLSKAARAGTEPG